MPAEAVSLLLRPRNFFSRNPVLDVPPSHAKTPSQAARQGSSCGCGKGDGSSVRV